MVIDEDKHKSIPGKKDRKRWCRGKEGVEHQTKLIPVQQSFTRRVVPQIYMLIDKCTVCGKHVDWHCKPIGSSSRHSSDWDDAWTRYRQQEGESRSV